MPGQDAFLDVLTNMVGIIILLVVVMGLRSSRAATASLGEDHAAVAAAAARDAAEKELQAAHHEILKTRYEVHQLMGRAVNARRETLLREQERQYLTDFVAAFNQELQERRGTLTTDQQRDFDVRRKLADAQTSLEDLSREQVTLLSQPTEAEVIENRPTPIVRGNTAKVLYVQLEENHVALIPIADLMEGVFAQGHENLWRLKEQNGFTGTVGPIGGYRLRYYVRKRPIEGRMSGDYSNSPGKSVPQGFTVELARSVAEPEFSPPGEPIDEVLKPGSGFLQELAAFAPESTSVRIAVYPDSIRALHRLQKVLHELGFGVDHMLVPKGLDVSFSPDGKALYAQ
jgi:hypothetical protein